MLHYDLRLDYRVDGNHLDGRAELHAVALTDVDELHVDLQGLTVSKVRLDTVPVAKFSGQGRQAGGPHQAGHRARVTSSAWRSATAADPGRFPTATARWAGRS